MRTSEPRSPAERVAALDDAARAIWFRQNNKKFPDILYDWDFWCRDDQHPPAGDWQTWLVMAGRGFGKTRMGAEWIRCRAETNRHERIAIVGATLAEARAVMVEGQSGLLNVGDPRNRPAWEPSLRKLTWPSGAIATLYSAGEPESLRGPEHSLAWADEIGKWSGGIEAWNNLSLTMRIGERPQMLATTTPRPVALVHRLVADASVARTQGSTEANRAQLPATWIAGMAKAYGGTRLGRQELGGELIADLEGTLWNRQAIENARVSVVPELARIVIGVDPPAAAKGDACGIIVAGLGCDGRGYVLADASVSGEKPAGWARAVARAAATWQADRVIAEANQGGEMVEAVLRAAETMLPIRRVHASRGKVARAEPVHTLYERGLVSHAGTFPALEDEMCGLLVNGNYAGPGRSPDRADALVWALSELMLGPGSPGPRVRVL